MTWAPAAEAWAGGWQFWKRGIASALSAVSTARFQAPSVGVEAAHVRWFNHEGPDDLDNGLALCSLHHKLLDRGAIGLSPERTLIVSASFTARTPAGRAVYELHGASLRPRPGTQLPADRHVQWHRSEVFKGDPLAA